MSIRQAPPATEGTTVVIRYDPEALFLTHELVAPLCEREVVLRYEAAGDPLGKLVMERMDSNSLQPKGVFVGRVRVDWETGTTIPEERREDLLVSGLDQLRSALSRRIVRPLQARLRRRVSVLEAMEQQLRGEANEKAKELKRRQDLAQAELQVDMIRQEVRSKEFEIRAAQQQLMMGTAKVEQAELQLAAGQAAAEQTQADLDRVRTLMTEGITSQLSLQTAESNLLAARAKLEAAAAQLENQRLEVQQQETRAEASEEDYAQLRSQLAQLEKHVKALLAESEVKGAASALQFDHETDRGRLTELGAELERARAELMTLQEVTVERW